MSRLLGFLIMAAMGTVCMAQTADFRILVKDTSGAGVQASGRLENLASGARLSFRTDDGGTYTAAGLAFGRYRLEVSRDGFATHASIVDMEAAAPAVREITLAVGVPAFRVNVVDASPLPGMDRTRDDIPGPVQAATQRDIEDSAALDISDFLNRRFNGVFWNEIQGNPMQPDVNYRGYTASPLLGTPQGLSVYMDGVRLNQPFGDVVSWDLIPRIAVSEVALMPGSNPLFGLNTLGGALSLRTKDGYSQPGVSLQISGGSFGRKVAEMEYGGSNTKGLDWYLASNLFFEDGWRESSPTSVRQFFGRIGYQRNRTSVNLKAAYANNSLIGNGLQEMTFLNRDYASVHTKPDQTLNQAPSLNLTLRHAFSPNVSFSGNAYFRYIRTRTLNGDINEESLDQALYQPNAAERAALAAAGYTGYPTSGENASNTPFPFWRCIGNALLVDEPSEKCNGLLNRGTTYQRNWGLAGQVNWASRQNQLTVGGAYDGSSIGFSQLSELGYLNPDRSVTGIGVYGDGVTGGDADGEPYDTRVNLSGRIHSGSFFVTDTLALGRAWRITASGRFNHTTIENRDLIRPVAGVGSLTGTHSFNRFNPAVGATFRPFGAVAFYANYTEGNRAPTSIELGCADPNAPCKLPNAMAGDPPLNQVVTRTVEAGVRSAGEGVLRWSAGWFRADNRNDILFVSSEQTGYGYFRNFGRTLRQGVELDMNARVGRVTFGAGYTFLDATFQSSEEVNGAGNSTNEEAQEGVPGQEAAIEIEPGNRIPLVPRHMFKTYADFQITSKLFLDVNVIANSGSYARGNENNLHQPDGTYYIGPGTSPAYGIVNLSARYQMLRNLQLFVQVNNLFDKKYYTGAQLGPMGFTDSGNFIARPFPPIDGEYPVRQSTFFAPGAPIGAWAGLRVRF